MMTPKTLLTPKELADAIGASESSLRRWVDSGRVRMSRTAGGHRRIPVAEAVRFIRESGATVVRPELLGLAHLRDAGTDGAGDDALFEALHAGDRGSVAGLIASRYLKGQSLPALFDGPVRGAMQRVGELWRHDARGILIEHRATDACIAAFARLRDLIPAADAGAPVAIGGAPEGDPYVLPSLMAGLVLADAGFADVNFGANTPVDLLGAEAVERGARVVWLSVSAAPADAERLRGQVGRLAAAVSADVVVGGLHAGECVPRGAANVHHVGSMGELAAFARGVLRATPA